MQGINYIFGNGAKRFAEDTLKEMRTHDRNGDNQITEDEAFVRSFSRPYTSTVVTSRIGPMAFTQTTTRQTESESDMRRWFNAARAIDPAGNPAAASYQELEAAMSRFDFTDKAQRRAFNNEMGILTDSRTRIIDQSTGSFYDHTWRPSPDPSYPSTPSYPSGPSTGDTYSPSYPSGPSSGDTYSPSYPSGGDTGYPSGGDDYPDVPSGGDTW